MNPRAVETISRVAEIQPGSGFPGIVLDIYATDWWSFRIGKQQVAWANQETPAAGHHHPFDSTWHLSPFEEFADQRVHARMPRTQFDISRSRQHRGRFQPYIDRERDRRRTADVSWGVGLPWREERLSVGLEV
jgi:hypothetical protein